MSFVTFVIKKRNGWISVSSRPAWSTKQDPGRPGLLDRETLSKKKKKKTKGEKKGNFIYVEINQKKHKTQKTTKKTPQTQTTTTKSIY